MKHRLERVCEVLKRELGIIICRELDFGSVLVTVSAVDITPDLKQALRAQTGGIGPDVIYDCVGGAQAEPALRSLRSGGTYLVIGFASRAVPNLPLDIVLVKELVIAGINWPASVMRNQAGYRNDMTFALDAVATGALTPVVHGHWPLADVASALAVLDSGEATGKIVITVCGRTEPNP
jgi:NADPH2:quinone reductase